MQASQKTKQAQKRNRGDKNVKRLPITRRGRPEINQLYVFSWNHKNEETELYFSTPSFFSYARFTFLWMTMVALDALTGFRFELLWPAWLMIRAAVESLQTRNQHCVTTIANPSAVRFSILFVCVTATSDLICYLFIPVRVLIFCATVFVWVNFFYHSQGGFLRTMATVYGGERSQAVPIVVITCCIVLFELFIRIRITMYEYILLFRSQPLLLHFLPNRKFLFSKSMTYSKLPIFSDRMGRGTSSVATKSQRFFRCTFDRISSDHDNSITTLLYQVDYNYIFNLINYILTFSEWQLRRTQGDVSNRNEQLFRILVESLPAEYEGPKDYTSQQCLEDGDLYYLDPPVQTSSQPMQAIQAAPSATPPTTSKKNGIHKKNGEVQSSSKKKKNGNAFNSTPPNDKKKNKSIRGTDVDDVDDSDADDFSWRDQSGSQGQRRGGGLSIIRIIFTTVWWMISALFVNSGVPDGPVSQPDDEYEEEEVEVEKKNGRTDSLTNSTTPTTTTSTTKGRANTMPSTTTRNHNNNNNNNHQQKQQNHKQSNGKSHHHNHQNQKSNGNANGHARSGAVRDSSHDTNASNENDIRSSMSRELETLRAEISSRRSLEEDYKLQISMHESNHNRLSQQLSNMKLKAEQMEIKYSTLEKHRESDKSLLEQSERKYSDLLGKKEEIESILSAERKARQETASKKYDVAEHQRERERQLESEIDKLRAELKSKEESKMRMESELNSLRNYKEEHDIEAISMELRIVRDKSVQMEESLAGENKLKQSLFKCLGDARDTIKSLERRCAELQTKNGSGGSSETLMNGRSSTEANNENDTTASDQSSPHQHSAMGSPVPFAKMPLTVNVSNRHGSPFSEKLSPIASIGSVISAAGGPAPPDYMMAVGASAATIVAQKQPAPGFSGIRYNEFTHMPTGGEHRLFDTPALSASSPNGTDPEEDFLSNMGKFGAPAQPAARLA
ncbi:Protein CBR-MACO-1 [Caenorhabditis briggsae]|uniref:Protein CBR-MACO-1 n=1 Tax=Caenorhabditis briggsae TaxID=6238 RepID=A8XGC0_CAEBR|nr:Protein CBR-MACO-1 [Caenorhabditis briggsae]CAP31626.2 Protein CBR-MACO-1 [Caenorhabditis briggsae]